jgi:hypothetical protein
MLLALDAIWRDIVTPPAARPDPDTDNPWVAAAPRGIRRTASRRRPGGSFVPAPVRQRLVVVDEAWTCCATGKGQYSSDIS